MPDTGYKSPTATGSVSNQFTSPTNAYSSNDIYATETTAGQKQDYYNFTFNVPSGATIDGVLVEFEILPAGTMVLNGDAATVKADITIDNATSWSAEKSNIIAVDAAEQYWTYGGATDKWGLTLTDTGFSNTNFKVRIHLSALSGGTTGINLDHVQVKVYYTPGAVTGTLSKTLDSVTKSMAGQVAISGSFNKSLDSVTKSLLGAVAIAGTSSKTLSAVTAVSAGQVALSGSLAKTLDSLDKSISGQVAVWAIMDKALGAILSPGAAGAVEVTGGGTFTLGGLTLNSAGAVAVIASLLTTLESLSGEKLGAVEIQAIVNSALSDLTAVGQGGVQILAVTDATLGTLILVSSGGETGNITGSLQQVLGALAGTLNGAVGIVGDLDATLGGTVTVVHPGVVMLEDGRMAVRAGKVYIIL